MVDTYSVEPTQLESVDTLIAGRLGHARTELASLRAAAHAVRWHGAAAADFRAVWAEWSGGVERLLDSLGELADAVGLAGVGYAVTESVMQATIAGADG